MNLREYEIAYDRVEAGNKALDEIRSIITDLEELNNQKVHKGVFGVAIGILDDAIQEIEESITDDAEKVDEYEREELEDERYYVPEL